MFCCWEGNRTSKETQAIYYNNFDHLCFRVVTAVNKLTPAQRGVISLNICDRSDGHD